MEARVGSGTQPLSHREISLLTERYRRTVASAPRAAARACGSRQSGAGSRYAVRRRASPRRPVGGLSAEQCMCHACAMHVHVHVHVHVPCMYEDLHRAHAHATPLAGGRGGDRCVQRVPVEALYRSLQARLHARGMSPGDGSAAAGRQQLMRLREALPEVPRRSRLGGTLATGEESTQRAATHLAHRASRGILAALPPRCVAGGAHKREEVVANSTAVADLRRCSLL